VLGPHGAGPGRWAETSNRPSRVSVRKSSKCPTFLFTTFAFLVSILDSSLEPFPFRLRAATSSSDLPIGQGRFQGYGQL